MTRATTSHRLIVTGLAAAGIAAAAIGAAPMASAAGPNQLCNVNVNTQVFDNPGGSLIYTITAGGGWRVDGYDVLGPSGYYSYGHGSGHSSGWIRDDGRIVNCR